MKRLVLLALSIMLLIIAGCKKQSPTGPQIFCGDTITTDCLNHYYVITCPSAAHYYILPKYYRGSDCLLLVNPHPSHQVNPPMFIFTSVIDNIQPSTGYKLSCDVKIKGYPDYANNPSFAFDTYSSATWYGQFYYFSRGGAYVDTTWTNNSFIFTSGTETTLNFQFTSIYDSVWISNFNITPL